MSSEIIEVSYDTLKAGVADKLSAIERNSLETLWHIGDSVDTFCKGVARNNYGAKTIQNLATDLQEMGYLSDIPDPTRFLYWAKAIRETYTVDSIRGMIDYGYTVFHAKLLLSLNPDQRKLIDKKMFKEDGTIISGNQLRELIKTELKAEIKDAAIEAVTEAITAREAPTLDKQAGAPKAQSEDLFVADAPEPGKELETPKPDPKPEAATRSEPDTPPNALKTLRSVEKAATKILAEIPSAFIVLRSMGQRGFDSDRAQQNYNAVVTEMKTSLADILEPIQELLREIEEQDVT